MYWSLRRESLCDPPQCPNAESSGRCQVCPLDLLEDSLSLSDAGRLLARATNIRAALKFGFHLSPWEIGADVFAALLVIEQLQAEHQEEKLQQERDRAR